MSRFSIDAIGAARYKAILVQEGEYFLECSRYIHLNPNRSRLTRPAERYRWSSYRNYVLGGPVCVDWVTTGRTLEEFGGGSPSLQGLG